jgi:hypothetical protein
MNLVLIRFYENYKPFEQIYKKEWFRLHNLKHGLKNQRKLSVFCENQSNWSRPVFFIYQKLAGYNSKKINFEKN